MWTKAPEADSGLVLQGAEGQKPGFGYGGRAADYKSAHKGLKGADAQGTLSRLFKLVRTPWEGWEEWRRAGQGSLGAPVCETVADPADRLWRKSRR